MSARYRHLTVLVLGLLLEVLCASFTRADNWPVPRGPARDLEPYHYDPAQWKKVPREFLEEASVCMLYTGTTHWVEADGTIETTNHEITRFNGRKGIESLGEHHNITYTPAYQTLTLHKACVHKADGRTVSIEPRHVHLRDLSTDYQVYDQEKQLIISFPSLEVGDCIEVQWSVRGKNPEHQGHFFTRYTFGYDDYPVVRDELRVCLPKERVLKHATIGGQLATEVRDEGDRRLYRWRVTNRRELPQDDSRPSREELRLQVACSTFPSWDAIAQWKKKLRSECWKCTEDIRKAVQEIIRGSHTQEEKACRLTYWVRRNIRYVAAGQKHDYTPHPPARVFGNRYGDCKDQSQLLAVMLKEAGIPVALVTLGTRDDGQVLEEVPSPWGTHAILLVTLQGKDHWIDTTHSLGEWDYVPRDDRNRLCYVVDDKGLRLLRTPTLTADGNRIEQVTHITVGTDGVSHCRRSMVFHRAAAVAQRENWVEVPAGERRRLMASELQDAHSKARLVRLEVDERRLKDFEQPVHANVVFDIPGHFGLSDSDNDEHEGSITDSKVWNKLLSFTLDYDRQLPLQLSAPFESRHRYIIDLPSAYRFKFTPNNRRAVSRWGMFTAKCQSKEENPRHLEIEFYTRIESTRVERGHFEEFRKFHEAVNRNYRVWLSYQPTQDKDDIKDLENVLAATPDDTVSSRVLAQLYLAQEKKTEARQVLQQACYYRPKNITLWEMRIKAAEDATQVETAYRDLVQHFPHAKQYVLDLARVLIDRENYAEAQRLLEPLAKSGLKTYYSRAHFQLARLHWLQNQPKKTLEHLEQARRNVPQGDDQNKEINAIETLRGRTYEKLDQNPKAVEAYRQALEADTEDRETLLSLIRLSMMQNQRSAALDYLRRYTLAVRDDADGMLQAAGFYMRLKHYEDALDLATRSEEKQSSMMAQCLQGLVHIQRGDFTQAVICLRKSGPDPAVLDQLIDAHLALGQLREAERLAALDVPSPPETLVQARALVLGLTQRHEALLKALASSSNKKAGTAQAVEAFLCAEHAYLKKQSPQRVTSLLQKVFQSGVELGPAYALRSRLAVERGQLIKALEDAERAIVLSPQEAEGYYVRGRVRLERGKNGALKDLSRAATLSNRQNAKILHWLATALFLNNRYKEALETQRQAQALKPEDPEILEQWNEFQKQDKIKAVEK